MRSALVVLAIVAAQLAIVPSAGAVASGGASVGFAVSPLRYDVAATPGGTVTRQVTVRNTDTVAATYRLTKEDIAGDRDEPTATPVLLGGKRESSMSGYDWLVGYPKEIVVPAGGSKTFDVRIKAPSDAKGGHYAALLLNGPPRTAGDIVASSRVAVLFLMNAGGVPPGEIVIEEVTRTTGGGTVIRYVTEELPDDGGPVPPPVTPKPTVIYKDPVTGKLLETVPGECSTALPGGAGECHVPGGDEDGGLIGLKGGHVELDPGTGASARAELPTEWAGTWTSMILPLVGIALFALYFVFLRRRRQVEAAA